MEDGTDYSWGLRLPRFELIEGLDTKDISLALPNS